MRRRLSSLVLAVAAALALGACGSKEEVVLHGSTEGAYLDLGPLVYQVQISRLLNPFNAEDRGYLVDVAPQDAKLTGQQQWFAVFMRVQNTGDRPAPAASDYKITDTQGTVFRPVRLGPKNVFAYRPATLPPEGVLPVVDSPAAESTIQGSLLLFKIPTPALANRPLELSIRDPAVSNEEATVDLDI
jgi:hypothetical protein